MSTTVLDELRAAFQVAAQMTGSVIERMSFEMVPNAMIIKTSIDLITGQADFLRASTKAHSMFNNNSKIHTAHSVSHGDLRDVSMAFIHEFEQVPQPKGKFFYDEL